MTPTESMEDAEEMLFDQMLFGPLMEHKVNVRSPCEHCRRTGSVDGDVCQVCQGDKFVTQAMSLYRVTKMIMPLIMKELAKRQQ